MIPGLIVAPLLVITVRLRSASCRTFATWMNWRPASGARIVHVVMAFFSQARNLGGDHSLGYWWAGRTSI